MILKENFLTFQTNMCPQNVTPQKGQYIVRLKCMGLKINYKFFIVLYIVVYANKK